tara:strand:- start:467 stop:745 length:279 start_codon:yes stop_codon:yes gene_type:complete
MDFLEDLELYNQAMYNAYSFITGKQTLDTIAENLEEDIEQYPLPFDPFEEDGKTPDVIDMVICHFTELEEYEKCAELVRIKDKCQNLQTPTE